MNSGITSIVLHASPAAAPVSFSGETNVATMLSGPVEVRHRLGEPDTATLRFGGGTPVGQAALAGTALGRHQTVTFYFDDGSLSRWRVESATVSSDGSGVSAQLWPYWTMLDRRIIQIERRPTGFVDLALALVNTRAKEALVEVFKHNLPPHFALGTVAPALANALISVDLNGQTHLTAVQKICEALSDANDGYPAEFEVRWSGSTCLIDVVPWVGASAAEKDAGYVADASLRPIKGPTGGSSDANRITLRRTNGGREFFNRIIPVAGPDDERVTIAEAVWPVATAVYAVGPHETTITLEDAPLVDPFAMPGGPQSLFFGYMNGETPLFWPLDRITNGKTFVVQGDASALEEGRFAADSTGTDLIFLENADSAGDDVAEQLVSFADHPPYENLLRRLENVSENLEDWIPDPDSESGNELIPVGITYHPDNESYPVITRIEASGNENYVRHGPYSAKIVLEKGDAIRFAEGELVLNPTDEKKWHSLSINAAVDEGKIRLELIDSEAKRIPGGPTKAETSAKNLVALSIGGAEPAAGEAFIEITALEDATFYIDALNVTRSTSAYQYRAKAGPRDLWIGALEVLRKRGGDQFYFDTDFIDATLFDALKAPAEIGSYVQIQDAYDPETSSFRIEATGRVHELYLVYSIGGQPIKRQVRVQNERPDVLGRLLTGTSAARIPDAPGADQFSEVFESTFSKKVGADAVAELAETYEFPGSYPAFVLDIKADLDYGTLLEFRFEELDAVQFYTLHAVKKGERRRVEVSIFEPVYTEGHEGDPAYVTNQTTVTIPEELEIGFPVFVPISFIQNQIRQVYNEFKVVQTRQDNAREVQRIAQIGEDAEGTLTSLDNLAMPPSVNLRPGIPLAILTDQGPQDVTVSAETPAGSSSIPIYAAGIRVKEGDDVIWYQNLSTAELRVTPGEVETKVGRGREATKVAKFTGDIAAGSYASLPVEALEAELRFNERYIVEDRAGQVLPVWIKVTEAIGSTSIEVQDGPDVANDVVFPADFKEPILRHPSTEVVSRLAIAEDEIDLRVESSGVVSAINLSPEVITIDSTKIQLNGTIAIGDSVSSENYSAGSAGFSLDGDNAVELWAGADMLIDSVLGLRFGAGQGVEWRQGVTGQLYTEFDLPAPGVFDIIVYDAGGDDFDMQFYPFLTQWALSYNGTSILYTNDGSVIQIPDLRSVTNLEAAGTFEHTGLTFGMFGETPVGQRAPIAKITDNTSGTVTTSLSAISGSGADAAINSAIASILDKLNKLIEGTGNVNGIGLHSGG